MGETQAINVNGSENNQQWAWWIRTQRFK